MECGGLLARAQSVSLRTKVGRRFQVDIKALSPPWRIRRGVGELYRKFTAEEIAVLLPDIVEAIRKPAPSGEMFAYDIRFAGLDLLSRLRIREGMSMCVDIMDEFRWGRKLNMCAGYSCREEVAWLSVRKKARRLNVWWPSIALILCISEETILRSF